jgi:hypothetical protein
MRYQSMRNRNLNAEITCLRAALTARVTVVERSPQVARDTDNTLRAPPEPGREVPGVEHVIRVAQKVAANVG